MLRFRKYLAAGFTAVLASAGAVVVAAPVARAETVAVTNLDDDGTDSSLRGVLEDAQEGDVVELVAGATYALTRCEVDPPDVDAAVFSTGELLIPESVTINGNGATIRQTCEGWRVILSGADLTLDDVTVTGGTARGGGGGIRLNTAINSVDAQNGETGTLVIRNSTVAGNCSTSNGGGIKMNVDGDVVIVNSTIAGNQADQVGGGLSHSHVGNVTIVNSTVTENTSYDHAGLDVRQGNLTAVYADIVGNITGVYSDDCGIGDVAVDEDDGDIGPATIEAANVAVNENYNFYAFATVVASPGTADNCSVLTTSSGYNYSDDDSCGFDQTTDTENGADPQLGALAANGGPTSTMLPALTSPLVNAIPTAACSGGDDLAGSAITTDQRLLVRPDVVNQQCDIGSVEVQTEAVEIEPNFTG